MYTCASERHVVAMSMPSRSHWLLRVAQVQPATLNYGINASGAPNTTFPGRRFRILQFGA
jgi:hypothetical protein